MPTYVYIYISRQQTALYMIHTTYMDGDDNEIAEC
jgi:hypothetical protein